MFSGFLYRFSLPAPVHPLAFAVKENINKEITRSNIHPWSSNFWPRHQPFPSSVSTPPSTTPVDGARTWRLFCSLRNSILFFLGRPALSLQFGARDTSTCKCRLWGRNWKHPCLYHSNRSGFSVKNDLAMSSFTSIFLLLSQYTKRWQVWDSSWWSYEVLQGV